MYNFYYSVIVTRQKGGINIKLQQALEQVCANAIEEFLSSNDMKLYLNDFLNDNANLILENMDSFEDDIIPVKCNINIKVDLKV